MPDSAALASAAKTQRKTQLTEQKLSPAALAQGNVKAVVGATAVKVDAASLASQVERNAVFIERVRTAAQPTQVPKALASVANAPQTATLLTQEIIATAADTAAPVRLKAFARDSTGLSYSFADRTFGGEFVVAFASTDGSADSVTLSKPVSLAISATGAKSIVPSPVEVADTGRWYPVKLVVPNPSNPYKLTVSANPQDVGDAIALAVTRPQVIIATDSRRVFGWGLGKVTLHVSATDREAAGTTVNLDASHGTLTPAAVLLDQSGQGTTELRSSQQGTSSISVAEPFTAPPLQIDFSSPLLFIVLALLGGVTGAFLSKNGRKKKGRALAIGAVTGLVLAMAYVVGLDWVVNATGWTALATAGEAVIFVLGALGALVGVQVLTPTKS